jgi:hypothetical protein
MWLARHSPAPHVVTLKLSLSSPTATTARNALQDLDNTVGAWDMYGQEDSKRYPDMQNEFFERAAGSLASRGAMLRFLFIGAHP